MLPSRSGILAEAINTKILTKNHPDSPHSHPDSPHSHPDSLHSHPDSAHSCIPRIPTLIPRVPTLIPRVPNLIPRVPTLITRVPIIPLIPFRYSPFQLLGHSLNVKLIWLKFFPITQLSY